MRFNIKFVKIEQKKISTKAGANSVPIHYSANTFAIYFYIQLFKPKKKVMLVYYFFFFNSQKMCTQHDQY